MKLSPEAWHGFIAFDLKLAVRCFVLGRLSQTDQKCHDGMCELSYYPIT